MARLLGVAGYCVLPCGPGEIDPGCGGGGHAPGGSDDPVAAINQAGSSVGQAGRLATGHRARRWNGRHQASPEPAVVSHPVNVQAILGAGRADFEGDRLALVDADIGGETLNTQIAGAADVPYALSGAGQTVLGDDRVRGCVARQRGQGVHRRARRCVIGPRTTRRRKRCRRDPRL